MDPVADAVLRSWSLDPWLGVGFAAWALLYARGWWLLHRQSPQRFRHSHLACYSSGLAIVLLALASPIEPFSGLLLSVHMLQHLLLMMVAPPLLWLGAPALPLLRGLPLVVQRHWIGPLLRPGPAQRLVHRLTHPAIGWSSFVIATWVWHAPALYERALRSDAWHYAEHACFIGTALLFWYPVIAPYPSRRRFSRWLLLPYLLLADVQNTLFSALFCFAGRVIYPHYALTPSLGGISPLDDQRIAGLVMWIPGSLAFLAPLPWLITELLSGRARRAKPDHRLADQPMRERSAPSAHASKRRWDLLEVPLLGQFLRWRHARLTMQVPLFALALGIVADGLLGTQVAPMNLAGVLPWTHWRGLAVIGFLIVGNVFCMACPFMLPRTIARRFLPKRWNWPRRLRSKWLAAGLVALYLWAYEAFSLWASPWWTAWIIVGYFCAAFFVDGFFRGASFCKYVCPIGQFHFVQSLTSPFEIKVREPAVCGRCASKDCINGRDDLPGCDLALFAPLKSGNMDCTFCLDCVHACPVDNVGLLPVIPTAALSHDGDRSGIGRISQRPDLAALVLVLVFGAFANAAGMVAPIVNLQDRLCAALGVGLPVGASIVLLVELIFLPLLVVTLATAIGRAWSGSGGPWLGSASLFSMGLVPLGAAMWLDHFAFHLLTSAGTAIPVAQRVAIDLGLDAGGPIDWSCGCMATPADWLLRLEIVVLGLGLLASLHAGYRIALARFPVGGRALRLLAPWALVMGFLYVAGVWIVLQPMQMRGTMLMGE